MTKFNLGDLQKLVKRLEADLRVRSEEVAEVREPLEKEYEQARAGQRTVETYGSWRDAYLTQSAVAWVLSCVFVRYLEDNGRIDEVWLAGEGERMQEANERHADYFRQNPLHSDRDYFQHVFRQIAKLPGCSELLAEDRNPLWRVGISGDGARELLEFWQSRDEKLKRSFQSSDTRFLGDLYQDLSQEARKRYALLQTPEFVEEFILDYTLKPAIQEFGIEGLRLIDPACGSGHFLLGAFQRLLNEWQRTTNSRDAAGKALASVRGVDVNPFAVAIARFRLAMAFVDACEVRRLRECPEFHPQVFCGDSLLHGVTLTNVRGQHTFEDYPPDGLVSGDYDDARRVLSDKYHVVVGNPPYIVDSDKAHNGAVRERYISCHRKFSLAVPFTERIINLCAAKSFWGLITANSFMKREFGKKLILEVLPKFDLTHVIDSAGAYIPGHGTPTVIMFGRNQPPQLPLVRGVLGKRGEPGAPEVPSDGLVWQDIKASMHLAESETSFVSIVSLNRETLSRHPWSIGGGGVTDLLAAIEEVGCKLSTKINAIGFIGIPNADDIFSVSKQLVSRLKLEWDFFKVLGVGDEIRDWTIEPSGLIFFPYDLAELRNLPSFSNVYKFLWPFRACLENRTTFSQNTYKSEGLPWWRWHQVVLSRLRTPLSIPFAFVSTHNHFILDRGGKVFKQSAPVIKLPEGSTEEQHLMLLGLLNSSTACFWFKATGHNKGSTVDQKGARQRTMPFEDFWEISGTQAANLPVPDPDHRLLALTRRLDLEAEKTKFLMPKIQIERGVPTKTSLAASKLEADSAVEKMVSLQEELDWLCYELYGVVERAPMHDSEGLPSLRLGERAFEIALARSGDDTTWFRRHNSDPIIRVPERWPHSYRTVVEERLDIIAQNKFVELLEKPEYKRRWVRPSWDDRVQEDLRTWLLERLEAPSVWYDSKIQSVTKFAEQLGQDLEFVQVMQLYRPDSDLGRELTELLQADGVPYLSVALYSSSGLHKQKQWEEVWELQREEDRGKRLTVPTPPKYSGTDFASNDFWRLRGKLNVPKERFILYPGAERDNDRSLVVGWAGWDHLQRAMALAAYYNERKENDGWDKGRLRPLLAGLAELVPWLKQWHNEVHPEYGERLGDFYEVFVTEEARSFELTWEDLRQTPNPQAPRTRKRK